jgi:hypothetical protein
MDRYRVDETSLGFLDSTYPLALVASPRGLGRVPEDKQT